MRVPVCKFRMAGKIKISSAIFFALQRLVFWTDNATFPEECVSSRYAIEDPTENGFCIKVFSGERILIGFHIVGTGATELLSSIT